MTAIAEHRIPTASGGLALVLVLHDGSTCYDLVADNGNELVTVYLSHHANQHLMADLGSIITAMDAKDSYATATMTDAGVTDRTHPAGEIEMVLEAGSSTVAVTVDDKHGGLAGVILGRAGADALLLAAGRMVSHL